MLSLVGSSLPDQPGSPHQAGPDPFHFLILLFSKDEDISLTLNMNE